jgi:hypothetical protein
VKKSAVTTVYITGLATNPDVSAQPDDYATAAGVPLIVSAPGVLGNERDPDGEAITAELVSSSGCAGRHFASITAS